MKTRVKHQFVYDFSQTQRKELFAIALSFSQIFLDNNPEALEDTLFKEYWNFIRANKDIKTESGAIDAINLAYKRLEKITKGEDVDVHPLLLSVSAILYLWESGYYTGSKRMKALRIANGLYFKIEDNTERDRLRRTNQLLSKLIEEYENEKLSTL